jgi:hypothetical protein
MEMPLNYFLTAQIERPDEPKFFLRFVIFFFKKLVPAGQKAYYCGKHYLRRFYA